MSLSNDYQDEMGRLGSISDRELEQLAAGRTPTGDDTLEDLAAHLRTVRAACVATPDEFTQALHIAEITQTAQLLAENGEPVAAATRAIGPARQAYGLSKWRRRMEVARSSAIKLAAGVTAAMLSTVGFAYAGVDLPGEAAEEAFDAVFGVELPNQGNGDAEITGDGPDENADQTAFDVWAVISNWADERGCTFGQAVANAATGGENAPDCANAEGAGSQGDEASAKGRATADEASAKGRATADEAPSVGTSTANEASGGRSEAGDETGESASENGQSNNPSSGAESGDETGETASENGQSNNPTGSGRP
jgi:hypothetical protein